MMVGWEDGGEIMKEGNVNIVPGGGMGNEGVTSGDVAMCRMRGRSVKGGMEAPCRCQLLRKERMNEWTK